MLKYFDNEGNILSNVTIYDRDGFIKQDVLLEMNSLSSKPFPTHSDLVRCLYAVKVWNTYHVGSHQSVFSKI